MEIKNLTEPELHKLFRSIGDSVREKLPQGSFFCVLVFDNSGVGQYVSNANRTDIIKALRETAGRLERREDVPR